VRLVRCAIYTRKSSEEGLEQEFNSLDAQRDSGESFVRSQAGEGWVVLAERYDDGGFSGGNTERPGLQRLLADVEAGKVDCVVVYKVDRLSRSLLDFAQLMRTFEQKQVSFVSVTQQFNTATSMGRLILNVLLSFAQFEREIISERTRDKIAAACRKGKWTVGLVTLTSCDRPGTRGCPSRTGRYLVPPVRALLQECERLEFLTVKLLAEALLAQVERAAGLTALGPRLPLMLRSLPGSSCQFRRP
jgi:DNA invertase Pin-like site-specific DNA recombinase